MIKSLDSVIAIDFGTKKIGIAVGQRVTYTAQPLATIRTRCKITIWNQIKKIFDTWSPCLVIIGLPINMDNTDQYLTHIVRRFAKNLSTRFNIKVIFHDERLSTIEARSNLFSTGEYNMVKKIPIDSYSACIILESWLRLSLYNTQKFL